MSATAAAHHHAIPDSAETSVPSSSINLGLRLITKYGPLPAIALGLVGFVCWMLVADMKQMHQEHGVMSRLLYAQCYNDSDGDPSKIRVCLDAFNGR